MWRKSERFGIMVGVKEILLLMWDQCAIQR